jgi:signal transduction histidine kinase
VAREPSPSNGYLAVQETRNELVKWVQVDLGRAVEIDAVRLFPSRPQDFADTPGNGFPVRFRVEAANDVTFADAMKLFDTGEQDFVNPGDNPVTIPADGQRARFVRVTATRLYNRGEINSFALAEMQVWSSGENIALGAAVTALDRFDDALYPRWQPEFLVDGFNSKNRILNDAEWIAGLARRRELTLQLVALDQHRARAADAALAFIAKVGVGTVGGVLLLAGALLWRARAAKQRAVEDLRRRIASDLHDEIGSNLGSIALLAEAARSEKDTTHAAEDFATIERVAARTHESLREIVWFISPGAVTRAELVARMRESAPALLGGIACEVTAPATLRDGECPLEFARNVWLIFKESLHNAARHSGASRVSIRVAEPAGGFELEIRDDGHGFIESEVEPGNGLINLRRRAADMHGTLRISSEPGRGTTVHLHLPHS